MIHLQSASPKPPCSVPLEIVLTATDWDRLQTHLFQAGGQEQHAFLLAGVARADDGRERLLVREVIATPPDAFEAQTGGYLRLRRAYFRSTLVRCADAGLALIEVHCHPFGDTVAFSAIDLGNEDRKFPYVAERLPTIRHATMVVSPSGAIFAHAWDRADGRRQPVEQIRVVGTPGRCIVPNGQPAARPDDTAAVADARFDRQVRAFGPAGQRALAAAHVGVVGLGGNGAPLVQSLAHMGVRRFTLIDTDLVSGSNLNRLVGASPSDVGVPKVEIAARLVRGLHVDAQIVTHVESALAPDAARALRFVNILVGATDSAAARLALAILAARYLIPYVDMGLHVSGTDGRLTRCQGQVRVALPDGPCLICLRGVDPVRAGAELASDEIRALRAAAGYGTGLAGPAPALAPLNGLVANLAAWQVLGILTGAFDVGAYWFVDLLGPRLVSYEGARPGDCTLCGPSGERGLGDLAAWPRFGTARLPANIPGIMACSPDGAEIEPLADNGASVEAASAVELVPTVEAAGEPPP